MNASASFSGLWLPLISPLRQGRIDLPALRGLARHYREAGISGLVLFGSTGEGNLLTVSEKIEMIEGLREDDACLPLMFAAGGVDTQGVAALIRKLDKYAPAGWLIPPPYYLCPSQQGMLWHYRQIAWATQRPIMAYNVPKRTGSALTVASLERLMELPAFAGVKECDPVALAALRERGQVPAICGEDSALLEHWLNGGRCAIAASAHILPHHHVAIMEHAQAGRIDQAQRGFAELRHLIRLLFAETNPAPVKKALALQGFISDELRLPLMPASSALADRLHRALELLTPVMAR